MFPNSCEAMLLRASQQTFKYDEPFSRIQAKGHRADVACVLERLSGRPAHSDGGHASLPVRVRKQRPRAYSRWGNQTTPLKQTSLPALYNSHIMLGLCPLQSSSHNRCHLKLLCFFNSKSPSLFIFALPADFVGIFLQMCSTKQSLLFCVVQ